MKQYIVIQEAKKNYLRSCVCLISALSKTEAVSTYSHLHPGYVADRDWKRPVAYEAKNNELHLI